LLAAVIVGCGGSTQPAVEPPANHVGEPVVEPSQLTTVVMRRTACLGECPMYQVSIWADGHVDWYGQEHVGRIGAAKGAIDRGGFEQLAVALDASRFFERDERGRIPVEEKCEARTSCFTDIVICSDTSASIITVTRGTTKKTVTDDHCTDDADLVALEKLIDTIAKTATWIAR
jgi:hypothetical protein